MLQHGSFIGYKFPDGVAATSHRRKVLHGLVSLAWNGNSHVILTRQKVAAMQ